MWGDSISADSSANFPYSNNPRHIFTVNLTHTLNENLTDRATLVKEKLFLLIESQFLKGEHTLAVSRWDQRQQEADPPPANTVFVAPLCIAECD